MRDLRPSSSSTTTLSFPQAVRGALDAERAARVVGGCATATTALSLCETLQPDVALLDLRLPDRDGRSLLLDLRVRVPTTRILVITGLSEWTVARGVLRAGALGFRVKDMTGEQICVAVAAVVRGEVVLSP